MNCPMCGVPMHKEISFFGEQCMNWGCACYRMEAKQRKQITDAIEAAEKRGTGNVLFFIDTWEDMTASVFSEAERDQFDAVRDRIAQDARRYFEQKKAAK